MNAKISNRAVFEIVIVAWILIAGYYNLHTSISCRSRDFWGHVQYAEIITKEHRLPTPHEGWETFQSPLYYLIVSYIASPSLSTEMNQEALIAYGRALSVLFGGLSLLIITWFLQQINLQPFLQLLVILFTATTPKFVFVFSTFNNDSLATFLSIATLVLAYRLYHKWSKKTAWALLLVAAGSLYAKLTTIISIGCVGIVCCKNLLNKMRPSNIQLKIIYILALSIVLFSPWLVLHNYKHTGRLIATNFDGSIDRFKTTQLKTLFGVLFRIPQLQENPPDYSHEFDEPWIYPTWGGTPHPATKRFDTFSYTFIISILDEFHYQAPSVKIIWLILLIHLVVNIISLKYIFESDLSKLSAFSILFAHIVNIATMMPGMLNVPVPNVDFRYIAWTWLPWALLFGNALSEKSRLSSILNKIFLTGIIFQIYTLVVISGCWSE